MNNLENLFSSYFDILNDNGIAKYLQTKFIPVNFDKLDSTEKLWEKHDIGIKSTKIKETPPKQSLFQTPFLLQEGLLPLHPEIPELQVLLSRAMQLFLLSCQQACSYCELPKLFLKHPCQNPFPQIWQSFPCPLALSFLKPLIQLAFPTALLESPLHSS